ncbi:helix-turn-helix transcriptional regulator [Lactobacillus sp. PV034]|uniref:helix-turn-helix transcriptional regulator n=1 Tax=Lactobacillus sp. PV034 TaxID=2594495 RepID=UPI00223FCAE4|nr:helix-turn-helix transcriptional regulator [Lactobacillus sp. PV034]QNQ80803.1 helix-turn-helix transcriptional regulator [Lactobacillus sp. PV034]
MNRIKQLRKKKGLSQKELAHEFNKFTFTNGTHSKKAPTYATFSRWEKGLNTPTNETWNKLAKFFGVSVEYLQGAYSKEEVIEIAEEAGYSDEQIQIFIEDWFNITPKKW